MTEKDFNLPLDLTIVIPGELTAKQRHRDGTRSDGSRVRFSPKATKHSERVVAWAAKSAMVGREPVDRPVELAVTCVFEPPASWSKRRRAEAIGNAAPKGTKPDADNLLKTISDGLNGVAFTDDGRVARMSIQKIYGGESRTIVTVRELSTTCGNLEPHERFVRDLIAPDSKRQRSSR